MDISSKPLSFPFPPNLTPPLLADPNRCKPKLSLTTTMMADTRNPSYESTSKWLGKGLAGSPTAHQQQRVCVGKLKGEGLDMGRSDRRDKGIKEGERPVATEGEGGEGKQGKMKRGGGLVLASAFLTAIRSSHCPPPLLYAQPHPIPHLRRAPTSICFHYALTLTRLTTQTLLRAITSERGDKDRISAGADYSIRGRKKGLDWQEGTGTTHCSPLSSSAI